MNFFIPKQPIFFDLLDELCGHAKDMAVLFQDFYKEFSDFEEYSQKARKIENKADVTAHKIIEQLNRTFITPFDSEDLYRLTHELDDIVDLIENVIHNTHLYGAKEKRAVMDKFAVLIIEATDNLEELLKYFRKQKHCEGLSAVVIKIHELEDKGDLLFQDDIQKLFKNEKDPIALIKWKDLLECLEHVMDKFQDVSNTVQGIIVKSS